MTLHPLFWLKMYLCIHEEEYDLRFNDKAFLLYYYYPFLYRLLFELFVRLLRALCHLADSNWPSERTLLAR